VSLTASEPFGSAPPRGRRTTGGPQFAAVSRALVGPARGGFALEIGGFWQADRCVRAGTLC